MHIVIMTLIVATLSFEFLIENLGVLPNVFRYAPELLALIACVMVVLGGVRTRFEHVRPAYWLLFGALTLSIACGVVVNNLPPGPLFAGMRTYLRAIPFFFLPAMFLLSDKKLRSQLYLLAAFCLLQLPIALQQRMATSAAGLVTGDATFGTLMYSGRLTVFLVPCAAVITAFFLRKRLSVSRFLVFLAAALAPTMLNESKAALVMAPIVLLTVFLVASHRGARFKNLVLATLSVACFVAVFVPVYDYYRGPQADETLVEFFTTEGRLESYLDRGNQVGGATPSGVGKLGALRHALTLISRDATTFVFGVGIGNVSPSSLGPDFEGQYVPVYGDFIIGGFAVLIAEMGMLGVGLICLLGGMIFKDSVFVARRDSGVFGAIALGWTGVVVAMCLGMVQTNPILSPALSFLFLYFTGLVVAQRSRIELAGVAARRESARRLSSPRTEIGASATRST